MFYITLNAFSYNTVEEAATQTNDDTRGPSFYENDSVVLYCM